MGGAGGSGDGGYRYVCGDITGVAYMLSIPGGNVSSALNCVGGRSFPGPHQRYHSAMFILSGKREWSLVKAVQLMEVNIFPPEWHFVHSLTSVPSGRLEWCLAPFVRPVMAGPFCPSNIFIAPPCPFSAPHISGTPLAKPLSGYQNLLSSSKQQF